MLQMVIDKATDDHPEFEARTAIEVSHLYGLLASLFRAEPSIETLRALRAPELSELLGEAGIGVDQAPADEADDAELLEEMAVEYTALFIGPGGHISPHESVHMPRGSGTLWGNETVAVKRFIEGLGLEYTEDYKGLPDHISVELDLMATLAGHEGRAWEKGDLAAAANALDYQAEFLDQHLLKWVPLFCQKVIDTAGMEFYRGLARLTRDFLASEVEDVARRRNLARPDDAD